MNKEIAKLKANLALLAQNLKQSLDGVVAKLQDIQGNNYRLGVMHLERGNTTDAVFRFTLVTRLSPKNANAWLKLAEAQLLKGNRDKAKQAFAAAKKIEPYHPDIPALVEKFNTPAPAPTVEPALPTVE